MRTVYGQAKRVYTVGELIPAGRRKPHPPDGDVASQWLWGDGTNVMIYGNGEEIYHGNPA